MIEAMNERKKKKKKGKKWGGGIQEEYERVR